MKMKIDINSCRVCLENVGVIPFFQEYGDEIVSKMISSLFNIDVFYDETLPTNICTICLENIKLCILTKSIIVNSESMLNTYLKSNLIGESAENLNQIKVEPEDPVTTPKLIELDAEEIKTERSEDSSQDFEDRGLQIAQVQTLTSYPQMERMHENTYSDTYYEDYNFERLLEMLDEDQYFVCHFKFNKYISRSYFDLSYSRCGSWCFVSEYEHQESREQQMTGLEAGLAFLNKYTLFMENN